MIKKFFSKIKINTQNMRRNRKYLYATVLLGGTLILILLFIYISTDGFIGNNTIILPSENTIVKDKIKYQNDIILKDIDISTINYKEIIEKLSRPTEYSMSVLNEIYAFDEKKSQITSVTVTDQHISAIRDGIEYMLVNDLIYIEKNEQIKQYDKLDFTEDEIMGIPSYEQILDIEEDVIVEKIIFNQEQALRIKVGETKIYTISLATGLLMRFELFEDDILVRDVLISNLVILNG